MPNIDSVARQDKMLTLSLLTTERLDTSRGTTFTQGQSRYLLDPDGKFGLRVRCTVKYVEPGSYIGDSQHPTECLCQGRNWIPTTNLLTCVRAAWKALDAVDRMAVMENIVAAFDDGTDPARAAFDVVASALLGESKVV